jgi:hypothetical protein
MYSSNPVLNLLVWLFTGFGIFGDRFKHSKARLTRTEGDLVVATAEYERLKQELRQVQLEIQNVKQGHVLELNKERAAWDLQRVKERAEFEQVVQAETAKLKLEREQAELRLKFELEDAVKRAQLASDTTLGLKKLEFEQKLREAELKSRSETLVIKEDFAKKEATLHATLHKEMYDKLNTALVSMTQEGDKNTKFVHELMLKIFEKHPVNNLDITTRNYQGQLPKGAGETIEVEHT